MSAIQRLDNVISFHFDDTIYMYYNIDRECLTLISVKPAYNMRLAWEPDTFRFYKFHQDLGNPSIQFMYYDELCASVSAILRYHGISVPSNVTIVMT